MACLDERYTIEDRQRWLAEVNRKRIQTPAERSAVCIDAVRVPHWYVVRAHLRREDTAREEIAGLGLNTFAPDYYKFVTKHGKKAKDLRPLFPGYLFASFDVVRDRWGMIERQRSVHEIIRMGETPLAVPDGVMAELLGAVAVGEFDETRPARLKPGDAVEITEGPFEAFAAIIKRAASMKRMEVFISLFGGETVATVPLHALRIRK